MPGPPAARMTDMHTCPMVDPGPKPHVGGPIMKGSPDVYIGGLPAATAGEQAVCVGPPDVIIKGSMSVFINNKPAARLGDSTAHGGVISMGCPTVLIGDGAGGGGGGGAGAGGVKAAKAKASAGKKAKATTQSRSLQEAANEGTATVERCPFAEEGH